MRFNVGRLTAVYLALLVILGVCLPSASAQGLIMPAAGPVHRAMAGASTAAPMDAAGAGYWNPAAIAGLPRNEMSFGAELIYADLHLASQIGGGLFSGETFSNGGIGVAPTIATVYHQEDSPWTLGLGVYALVGAKVNFPTDAGNPLLSPFVSGMASGFGGQFVNVAGLQIAPMASAWITDRLAVGAGPTINSMTLELAPAFFAAPNADGSFSSAINSRAHWGGGFQVGTYFEANECWSLGFSYKSPQWFETFRYNSEDENGNYRQVSFDLTLPWIASLGVAYKGLECTTIAVDVRYFDYAGTKLLGESPPDGTGWESVFSVALGVQRDISERISLRAGYLFNENPIPGALTLLNTELPAITQHQLSLGGSYRMNQWIRMDSAVSYGFENSIQGTIAQLPNSAVRLRSEVVSLVFGMAVEF